MNQLSQARARVPRFAEAAVERARLTVVPRRVQRAPRVPFVSLVSLLLVGGVAGLLLFNTSLQQASFTATELEETAFVLDAREQSLQMELDDLRDPQKVAARAKRLGMVPRTSPAFIRLSDGKILGDPEVADADDAMSIHPLPTRPPRSLRPAPVVVTVEPKPERPTTRRGGTPAGATEPGRARGRTDQDRRAGPDSPAPDRPEGGGR